MSLLILDTTFLVDAERATERLDAVVQDSDDVAIAAVTLAELAVGVHLADDRHRSGRQAFLDLVSAAMPVLDYDRRVAAEHADLLVEVRWSGRPRGAHDLLIAATARTHRRTVVTADRSAFVGLPGVDVMDHRGT